jgi:UDP-galactopyranose mutase
LKILVVGAGFAGSTFARLAANDRIDVHVIDTHDHVGGNSYSFEDSRSGVEIHKYGPHIFHTDDENVYQFITQFTAFNNYVNRVKAKSKGRIYSLPINLHTINQFFDKSFSPQEAEKFMEEKKTKIDQVTNFEEFVLSSLGRELFEAFFRDYTIKQWEKDPKDIPLSTAKRLPIRYNYNDNYFDDKYQGIPVDGYGKMFEKILDHEKIKISLNTSFDEYKYSWQENYDYIVFTGSVDEFFDYQYGYLPYRTVRFEEIRGAEIQGNAVINYTDMSEKFTRIHEHKYFTPDKTFKESVAFKEYSEASDSKNRPYYPVETPESISMIEKYRELAKKESNVIFIGRLAEFKYYNMDQVIKSSMELYQNIIKRG